MSKKKEKNATMVGLFLFIGLVSLGIMIAQFSNISGLFKGDYKIQVNFPDASGLVKDSEITYGGAKVGRVVSKPQMLSDRSVKVDVIIKGGVNIPVGSTFSIYSVSLLGDKAISITSTVGESSEFYHDGDIVDGHSGGGLDAVTSQAEKIAINANEALMDIRNMSVKLDKSIEGFNTLLEETNISLKKINSSFLTDDNALALKESLASIKSTAATIKKIEPALEKIEPIFDEVKQTIVSVKDTSDTAQKTFIKVNEQFDTIEPALKDLPDTIKNFKVASSKAATAISKVEAVASDTKEVIAKVNKGDGVLHALTSDSQIKENTADFVKNLKKYGILRYRDKKAVEEENPQNDRFRGGRR